MKLLKYQRRGVRLLNAFNGRAILGDEMGLGKTIQALAYCKQHPEAWPILVGCPASIKYNWEREANRFGIRAMVLEGTKPATTRLEKPPMVIINYEILNAWRKWLQQLNPQVVIWDEAHYLKNRGAKRTKVATQLSKKRKHILALTGTPITNRPIEWWTLLRIIVPDLFPSYNAFGMRYCGAKMTPWGWKFKGATRTEELSDILREECLIRRRKRDVLKDLPKQSSHMVELALSKPSEYHKAQTDFINWLRERDAVKAKRAAKAERLVRWGYLRRLAAELKLPAVREWVDNFLQSTDEKLVLFGIHKDILTSLSSYWPKLTVQVDGSVTGRKRQQLVDKFTHDPKTRIFVGQLNATGVGLNLVEATTCGFVELGWTPAEHTQGAARIDRIGQTRETDAYFFVGNGTVETALCKVLRTKQEMIDETLDGGHGGEDIMTILEEQLRAK